MKNFSLEKFNNFLKKNNIYFYFTIHTKNPPKDINKFNRNLTNIIYIDQVQKPLFCINNFMSKINLLINDYSTTSTDFSLTKKPQIFYFHDLEKYQKKRSILENKKIINNFPGFIIKNYSQLIKTINNTLKNPHIYNTKFKQNLKILNDKFYDNHTNSCKLLYDFLKKL